MGKESKRPNRIAAKQKKLEARAEEVARLKALADEEIRLKALADEEIRLKALADEEAADAEFELVINDAPIYPVAAAINATVVSGNNAPGGGSNEVSFIAQPAAALTVTGEVDAISSGGWSFSGWFSK